MSLISRVQKDSQRIMNSERFGFSVPIVLIEPDETAHNFKGIVSIIHNLIDPDTGEPVSGFLATVSINVRDLNAAGVEIPEGVMSENERPWKVIETNQFGVQQALKIVRAAPDDTNGNILCDLGAYVS